MPGIRIGLFRPLIESACQRGINELPGYDSKRGKRMFLQELEQPHDADASPRIENQQVSIFRENHIRGSRQGKA